MSKLIRAIFAIAFFLIVITQVNAQTFSPYSALGLGDLYLPAQAHNQGMGGVGISNSSILYQGALNPALIADNSVYSFAAGFEAENKFIWQNDNREQASGGTLRNLNMSLPVKPGLITVGVGLSPYSNLNYNFETVTPVQGSPSAEASLFNKGSGGFNQFVFTTGIKVTKGLYLGGKASYLFSTITKERNNVLSQPQGIYVPTSVTRTTAKDFLFGAGAVYRYYFTDRFYASLGAVYDFGNELRVTRTQTLEIKSNNDTPVRIDTLLDNASGFVVIPDSYGVGFSITRQNNWTIGSDVRFYNWSDFKDFGGVDGNLVNTVLVRIGGEITPDVSSVDNYFERITYRVGLNIDQTPYSINGTQIDEIGINFGLSLPVTNFSSVDLGFRYGTRGTTSDNLIRENFFRVYFGVTFNDNRWFVRPKYN